MKLEKIWKYSPWPVVILLIIFFGVSLYLRVVLPYSQIFVGNWIKFTITDAYYFMRHIDNLVVNFPHFFLYDPFQYYPSGVALDGHNFFVYFSSSLIWLIGLGHPSQHTVDLVGAYLPAVLGALTIVPVYFIGKALVNRWVGLLSAAMIAILPGEFIGRTILGNTDRDAFEVMLTALTMLFFILAIKSASEKQVAFCSLRPHTISLHSRPLIYSIVLGILIGVFVLTWRGSFLCILTILVYFVVQSVINQFQRKSSEPLGFVCIVSLLIALIVFLIGSRLPMIIAALALSLLFLVVFTCLASILNAKKASPYFFPSSILLLALIGLGILYAISPSMFEAMLNQFRVFFPSEAELTVSQMQPILFPGGNFSLIPIWGNFTTGNILIFFAFGILIFYIIKRQEPDKILLLVWSLILLVAMLLTRRIALLFALNMAVMMGYLAWQILSFIIQKTAVHRTEKLSAGAPLKKKKKTASAQMHVRNNFFMRNRIAVVCVTSVALFFLFYFPSFSPAIEAVTQVPSNAPSDDWYRALNWLKENTPDPLDNPDAYYQYYSEPVTYPASAYGIASWWDFGYWIIRIGRRLPVCDPGGGPRREVAQLFTAQNEADANAIIDQLRARYLVIDESTINTKFKGVTTYAGMEISQFGESYYINNSGTFRNVMLYYPEYFQSLAVHLFRFNGKSVTPEDILVISYQEKTGRDGSHYKEITNTNTFSTYEEAKTFIGQQKSGNYRIASTSPLTCPVPLEALQHYKLIYPTGSGSSSVKIFEYTP